MSTRTTRQRPATHAEAPPHPACTPVRGTARQLAVPHLPASETAACVPWRRGAAFSVGDCRVTVFRHLPRRRGERGLPRGLRRRRRGHPHRYGLCDPGTGGRRPGRGGYAGAGEQPRRGVAPQSGPYPYSLKAAHPGRRGAPVQRGGGRVRRPNGRSAAPACIILAHLSRENNTPQRAWEYGAATPEYGGGWRYCWRWPPAARSVSPMGRRCTVCSEVTVLCVGKLKEKFYLEAAAEYVKRLQRLLQAGGGGAAGEPSAGVSLPGGGHSGRWRRRRRPSGKGCPKGGAVDRPVHRGKALLQRGAEPSDWRNWPWPVRRS